MIEVTSSPLLKPTPECVHITDVNKAQVIEEINIKYKQFLVKNSLTYSRTHEMIKLLVNGIFRRDLMNEIFENLNKDWHSLDYLKKYISDVAEVLSEDLEQEEYIASGQQDNGSQEQRRKWYEKDCEIESKYSTSVKYLGDELSVCSQQVYSNQKLSPYRCPELLNLKALQMARPITLTIFPPQSNNSAVTAPMSNSDLSTHSSHSLTKSCMITDKNKQFMIKIEQVKPQRIDYRKQYQKKLHNVLVKNAMVTYKKRK